MLPELNAAGISCIVCCAFFPPNKRSYKGPGGFGRGLDSRCRAKICARELAPFASRCLQGASHGLPLMTGRTIIPTSQERILPQNKRSTPVSTIIHQLNVGHGRPKVLQNLYIFDNQLKKLKICSRSSRVSVRPPEDPRTNKISIEQRATNPFKGNPPSKNCRFPGWGVKDYSGEVGVRYSCKVPNRTLRLKF